MMWPFKKRKADERFCCLCKKKLNEDENLCAWNKMLMKDSIWFCSNHRTEEVVKKCRIEDRPDIYNGCGVNYTIRI